MRRLAVSLYLVLSAALLFAQPSRDAISTWSILLGGPAGGLSLAVASLSDMFERRLDGLSYFNPEMAWVALGAMLVWAVGGVGVFSSFTQGKPFVLSGWLICYWVFGGCLILYLFAIRSV